MFIKSFYSVIFLFFSFTVFSQVKEKVGNLKSKNDELKITLISANLDTFPNVQLVFKLQDESNNPVWNILVDDFEITENGKKCHINSIQSLTNQVVLKINIIIDKSTSMLIDQNIVFNDYGEVIYFDKEKYHPPIDYAKESAINFISKFTKPYYLFSLTTFSDSIKILTPFVKNKKILIDKINKIEASGSTSLYDVIFKSATNTSSDTLFVNVLLTDGEDTYSEKTYEQTLEKLTSSNSILYIIGLGNVDSMKLKSFAKANKGEYFSVQNPKSLNMIYNKIFNNISSYYVINFDSEHLKKNDTNANYLIKYVSNNQEFFDNINIKLPENVFNYISQKKNIEYSLIGGVSVLAVGLSIYLIRRKRKTYNT